MALAERSIILLQIEKLVLEFDFLLSGATASSAASVFRRPFVRFAHVVVIKLFTEESDFGA